MPKSDYKRYAFHNKTCYFKRIGEENLATLTIFYFERGKCGYAIHISNTNVIHESIFNNRVNFRELEKMAHDDGKNVIEKYKEDLRNAKK